MSALSLRDFQKVQRIIKEAQSSVKVSGLLETVFREHNIGRPGTAGWLLNATDRSRLRTVVGRLNGLDPLDANPRGSRMDLARQGATDEKLARDRPLATRVVCTALPGPIAYAGELLPSVPDVEYRLDIRRFAVSAFDGVLSVENYEAFLAVHQINCLFQGNMLVVYRGHDDSSRGARELMDAFACTGKPVIYSSDVDPQGIQMALSSKATHALVPCERWQNEELSSGYWQRAADQLLKLPNIIQTVRNDLSLSPPYRSYALWVLYGRAFTEERLLSQAVPMQVVPIRA